ncbi:hypothetical protein ADL22_12235 [Streptomyces sp. NRRL F-4489]|uniref:hypothetical protein n=1 Tax=Streptomyces sp. NRRL F-4489 TaxID=1609095 RepID=UPI00074B15DF|nr:hypothetical protein [Streptomyces sp. NRRL F-4489]KUL44705.1 hypothetical protein ADL22_12235 [Streptomyces sp. NRRL F-4489]
MSEHIISSGQFPTMGKSMALASTYVQPQGGTPVKKNGNAKGGSPYPEPATGIRSRKLDRTGPGPIKADRHVSNVPVAGATGRAVTHIPTKFCFDTSGR